MCTSPDEHQTVVMVRSIPFYRWVVGVEDPIEKPLIVLYSRYVISMVMELHLNHTLISMLIS